METITAALGALGLFAFVMAAVALRRIRNLEKKLKNFDVIPGDFNSRTGD